MAATAATAAMAAALAADRPAPRADRAAIVVTLALALVMSVGSAHADPDTTAAPDALDAPDDPVRADDKTASDAPDPEPGAGGLHASLDLGGFVGVTGPAPYGLLVQADIFPGQWPLGLSRRLGLGVRWRGFAGRGRPLESGLVAASVAYEGGATRPHIALALHGIVGVTYGPEVDSEPEVGPEPEGGAQAQPGGYRPGLPVVGAGVRTQLAVWGPLAVALHADIFFVIDGVRLRAAVAPGISVALAR
ncbi:MAG: hypothetical protein Tsb0020_30960 [Haliangiales bacterium]